VVVDCAQANVAARASTATAIAFLIVAPYS
jgi:hypothetical protein